MRAPSIGRCSQFKSKVKRATDALSKNGNKGNQRTRLRQRKETLPIRGGNNARQTRLSNWGLFGVYMQRYVEHSACNITAVGRSFFFLIYIIPPCVRVEIARERDGWSLPREEKSRQAPQVQMEGKKKKNSLSVRTSSRSRVTPTPTKAGNINTATECNTLLFCCCNTWGPVCRPQIENFVVFQSENGTIYLLTEGGFIQSATTSYHRAVTILYTAAVPAGDAIQLALHQRPTSCCRTAVSDAVTLRTHCTAAVSCIMHSCMQVASRGRRNETWSSKRNTTNTSTTERGGLLSSSCLV